MSTQPVQQRAITAPPKRVWLLNAAHRCDGCGSRAYVYLVLKVTERLPDGGSLLMCVHHARQHWPKLKPLVWMFIDESAHLIEEVKDDGHYIEGVEARIPNRPPQPPKQP
jgi:hypothetical protein